VAERLGITGDRAVVDVEEVGNTSAASIPVALDRAWRAGRMKEGDLVLLTSFGAGLAWGANLVRWTDVTEEASVAEAFRRVTDEAGPIVGLVNNAGFSQDGLLLKYPMDVYEQTMSTNVRGAFLCSRAALRAMLRERWGRIVNMSSAVAIHGNAGQTVYAASKTALLGLTKSLAREVGVKGVTVNAICPGLLDTDMTSHLDDRARAYYLDQTPAGRTAAPEEVSAVVRFLMSEEASYVNGVVLPIDGGLTA
jgi:3-oxoacyl-[acyl-carrier protein] reductase